jgi:TrmH family RNA methyltransferase
MIPDFKNIYIILHSIENPGNIGSAARAMKNMGLKNMVLINPPNLQAEEAKKLAYSSYDIIEQATIVNSFDEALSMVDIAVATTRRKGKWRERFEPPEIISEIILKKMKINKIGIVFGTEKTGLTNDEVIKCEYASEIPTAVDYPSLNISQAVMIYVYELYRAFMRDNSLTPYSYKLKKASHDEYNRLFDRIMNLMNNEFNISKGFETKFSRSLNRIFSRTEWETKDIATFDAFLKHIEQYIEKINTK